MKDWVGGRAKVLLPLDFCSESDYFPFVMSLLKLFSPKNSRNFAAIRWDTPPYYPEIFGSTSNHFLFFSGIFNPNFSSREKVLEVLFQIPSYLRLSNKGINNYNCFNGHRKNN